MKYNTDEISAGGSILIRDMAVEDRPREKAIKHGIKSLTDAELMAIIFSTGLKGKSVVQMSEEILQDNDHHLSLVARLTVPYLTNHYKGLGTAKAISLLAALELGERSAADAVTISRPKVTNSQIAYEIMRRHFVNLPVEEFWIMLLNQAGHVIREIRVSTGGIASTLVDTKVVLKYMIENLAQSVIIFHNHPSGNKTPSVEDDRLTKRICTAVSAIGSKVNDHIIVTDSGFYSYADHDRMPTISLTI